MVKGIHCRHPFAGEALAFVYVASSQFRPFLQEVQLFSGVAAIYHFDMHFALAQVQLVKLMGQGAYICAISMTIETSGFHAKLHQQHFGIPCEDPRTMLCNKIDK
jgi:hypothetical protein